LWNLFLYLQEQQMPIRDFCRYTWFHEMPRLIMETQQ